MMISRREFVGGAIAAVGAAVGTTRRAWGQEPENVVITQGRALGATAKITTTRLRGNVWVMQGSGGNIAVLPGADGKLLVDSGYATSRPQIMEALTLISGDPMTHLINTHWHFDHTDGNEWMHQAGATVIAHEKTKVRLSTPQFIALFNARFPALPPGAIPTTTFAEKDALRLNGEAIEMAHYEPAHTDTDISVHFTQADVLHTGDTWFNGAYPFIDTSTGGSIGGMIRATERNLAGAGEKTMIIPGHGPVGTKAQLAEYRDVLVMARDKVAALKKEGKSVEEVVAAKPMAAYDAKWGGGFMKPEVFLGLVYLGV